MPSLSASNSLSASLKRSGRSEMIPLTPSFISSSIRALVYGLGHDWITGTLDRRNVKDFTGRLLKARTGGRVLPVSHKGVRIAVIDQGIRRGKDRRLVAAVAFGVGMNGVHDSQGGGLFAEWIFRRANLLPRGFPLPNTQW